MQTRLEAAVAGEVLAEIKRQRYTYKEIQAMSGVKQRAFSYYFVAGDRAIPLPALSAVCEALGVSVSEIVERAEDRLSRTTTTTLAGELHAGLDPATQALAESVRPKRDETARKRAAGDDGH